MQILIAFIIILVPLVGAGALAVDRPGPRPRQRLDAAPAAPGRTPLREPWRGRAPSSAQPPPFRAPQVLGRPPSRRRSCCESSRLRRIDDGVTSTSSSAAMNSSADLERDRSRGGVSRSASSCEWVRMLVSFFSLVGLTSMSPDRLFSPTIIPS